MSCNNNGTCHECESLILLSDKMLESRIDQPVHDDNYVVSETKTYKTGHDICHWKSKSWFGTNTKMWRIKSIVMASSIQ
jgi:hypothetical protein